MDHITLHMHTQFMSLNKVQQKFMHTKLLLPWMQVIPSTVSKTLRR